MPELDVIRAVVLVELALGDTLKDKAILLCLLEKVDSAAIVAMLVGHQDGGLLTCKSLERLDEEVQSKDWSNTFACNDPVIRRAWIKMIHCAAPVELLNLDVVGEGRYPRGIPLDILLNKLKDLLLIRQHKIGALEEFGANDSGNARARANLENFLSLEKITRALAAAKLFLQVLGQDDGTCTITDPVMRLCGRAGV